MKLNDRKTKILEAIINDYIATAEPIGSRTIAKKYDLGISSATIRNEMSDLEDMGYIIQPHASSGRVPSDKGYRLYVDSLMHHKELTSDEASYLKQIVVNNISQIDYLMRETAKAIALLTNYTTVVSEPLITKNKIKHVQLVPIDENSLVLVVVSDSKNVKNQIIRIQKSPSFSELNQLTSVLNNNLSGLSNDMIDRGLLKRLEAEFGDNKDILLPILNGIVSALSSGEDIQIYTSGIKNILAFPEFSNLDKARAIFQTLEEKDMLVTLLGSNSNEKVQIVIGAENAILDMQDCSIIKANYKVGNESIGNIGIIGPTRMDYSQVVSVLDAIVKNINYVIKAFEDG